MLDEEGQFQQVCISHQTKRWGTIIWRTRQLFTRARVDWSNRLIRTLWSSTKANRKSCTSTIINTFTSTVWGWTIWKTALQKITWVPGGPKLNMSNVQLHQWKPAVLLAAFCQCVKWRATKVLKDGMQDLWNWGNVFIQRLRINLIAHHIWIENREKIEPDSSWRDMGVEWEAMYTSWNRLK